MLSTETQHITRSRISFPRRRADLLTRQRLLDAMDELLDKKIILINAPAGYGKTSLLIDLADDLALPICWYALDTLDQNLPRFLEYLVAAIQVRFPDFTTSLINVLRSSTQKEISIDTAVSILSNDIYDQITEHFIIMLDDYHLIKDDPQVNHFLSQFVQQTEENCHIIFASRSLLALPDLPLLVARGLVGGLDQLDLAFNSHETRDLFFFQHHIVLSDDEAEILQKQTEGWVTGLLLTARTAITRLIPKQKVLRATGVNINDYFDLIYNAQSETIQEFLLYTSLLEEFSPSLFANTIGKQFPYLQEQYQECVDHILSSNLFVQSVQMDELSLRYHHLFLDYLQSKFKLEETEQYLELQVLIAGYYEGTQQWEQAYQIYEQEGMMDRQVRMLEDYGFQILVSGKLQLISKWFTKFSKSFITDNPILCSHYGAIKFNYGEIQSAIEYYDKALSQLDLNKHPLITFRTMVRKASVLRSLGHYNESIDLLNSIIGNKHLTEFQDIYAEANRIMGTCYFEMGLPILSNTYLETALSIFTNSQKENEVATTKFNLGSNLFFLGEFSQSEAILISLIDFWSKNQNYIWLASTCNNYAVLQHLKYDIKSAVCILNDAIKYSSITQDKRNNSYILNSLGDIYMDIGLYPEAKEIFLQNIKLSEEYNIYNSLFYALNALSKLAIIQNNNTYDQYYLTASELAKKIDSDYETNLLLFTKGFYTFSQNNYNSAIAIFQKVCDHFSKTGLHYFASKVALYIIICKVEMDKNADLSNELNLLNSYFKIYENKCSLIPVGILEHKFFSKHITKAPQLEQLNEYMILVNQKYSELPSLRKYIRKKYFSSFIQDNFVKITTLGSLKVKYNNKALTSSDWQTQSARDFFFLVLSNSAGFTKEDIGLLLWPDDTLQEFRYHFRNAIYRVRHAIGKDSILLEGDLYRFNMDLDFMLDARDFEEEVQSFVEAKTQEEKQKHYKRANKLYKGPYLPGMDLEIIRLERERLQSLFRQVTLEMCQLTFNQEDFNQTVELANQALVQDPCNEEICRLAMKAESARGNRAEIARIFERCESALLNEYEAELTDQTRKLYQILMRI